MDPLKQSENRQGQTQNDPPVQDNTQVSPEPIASGQDTHPPTQPDRAPRVEQSQSNITNQTGINQNSTPAENSNINVPPAINQNVNQNQAPNQQQNSITTDNNVKSDKSLSYAVPKRSGLKIVVLILVLLLGIGGVVYAFVAGDIFSSAPYNESNITSGLVSKINEINSSEYKVSAKLITKDREENILAFSDFNLVTQEDKDKYARDSKRADDVTAILSILRDGSSHSYPDGLDDVMNIIEEVYYYKYYYNGASIIDPLNGELYEYRITEGGKNYSLDVTFETDDAISNIESSYGYNKDTTKINNRTVTFTKESPSWVYMSKVMPLSFFEELEQLFGYVSDDISVSISLIAKSKKNKQTDSLDWGVVIDATGDLGGGDLTYKVNSELRKVDEYFYFVLNNFPTFFELPFEKKQWLNFNIEEDGNYIGYYSGFDLKEIESEFDEFKEGGADLIKDLISIADEVKLFAIENEPEKITKNDKDLYRYDLVLRKESVLPLYEKATALAKENGDEVLLEWFSDKNLDFLKSDEFESVMKYYNNNTKLTIWVDKEGYPVTTEYKIIVVPDYSVDLFGMGGGGDSGKDRNTQAELTFSIELDNINGEIIIETPEDSKSFEEILKKMISPYIMDEF